MGILAALVIGLVCGFGFGVLFVMEMTDRPGRGLEP